MKNAIEKDEQNDRKVRAMEAELDKASDPLVENKEKEDRQWARRAALCIEKMQFNNSPAELQMIVSNAVFEAPEAASHAIVREIADNFVGHPDILKRIAAKIDPPEIMEDPIPLLPALAHAVYRVTGDKKSMRKTYWQFVLAKHVCHKLAYDSWDKVAARRQINVANKILKTRII